MRALYIHISGLAGLLVFLKEVLNYAPLERTILVSATTGLTVYLMLIVGHTIVQRIMAYSPPAPPQPASDDANPNGEASQPREQSADAGQPSAALQAENASNTAAAPNEAARNPAPATDETQAPPSPEHSAASQAGPPTDEAPHDTTGEAPAPDRTPQPDRQDSSSEPMAQTTV
jgi:hypothetical protein